MRRLLSIFR